MVRLKSLPGKYPKLSSNSERRYEYKEAKLVDSAVTSEITNMYRLKVWDDVERVEYVKAIPSFMFLKAKYDNAL